MSRILGFVPISSNPEARARQIAALRRGSVGGTGSHTLTHGARSEVLLGPLRVEAEAWGRRRWPWLDAERLGLVASLAARVKRTHMWLDDHDMIDWRSKHRISAHPIVQDLHGWERSLQTLIKDLDVEGRARRRRDTDVDAARVVEMHFARQGDAA